MCVSTVEHRESFKSDPRRRHTSIGYISSAFASQPWGSGPGASDNPFLGHSIVAGAAHTPVARLALNCVMYKLSQSRLHDR